MKTWKISQKKSGNYRKRKCIYYLKVYNKDKNIINREREKKRKKEKRKMRERERDEKERGEKERER